ncbi:galactosyltransferase-related protein [Bacteroides sp.]
MNRVMKVSIVIPLRVDSKERLDNLNFVLFLLLEQTSVEIDILEADVKQHFHSLRGYGRVRYRFVEDSDPIFHRTRYLNQLLFAARHPVVGVWDTDVIISPVQLQAAVEQIRLGSVMCFPYDGRFIFLDKEQSLAVRQDSSVLQKLDSSSSMRPSVGGAFLVNREKYLAAGGENERFYGWGPEDAERVKRMEILELPVSRVEGPLFHLHHPRGVNSGVDCGERDKQNLQALIDTCRMTREELLKKTGFSG